MLLEAGQSAKIVHNQRPRNREAMRQLGERLRSRRPRAIVTLARGSSDHAATYARYLIERKTGVLTSSLSPSIASVYGAVPDVDGTILLAISQSGRSPDLLAAASGARAKGSFLVAVVNDEGSPLASLADLTIALAAGPERSVAASKSFIASLAAIIDLIAAWTKDPAVEMALESLPLCLERAFALDWASAVPVLERTENLYVVGRGHGFAIAQEAALKLKETCLIHAEAFSGAEVRHGPMALVRKGFPIFLFGQPDQSLEGMSEIARAMDLSGATLISAGVENAPGLNLPVIAADPLISPILSIASFYRLANALALARGLDPDSPPHLAKVTKTR